jgi:oxygen-dependent protoporphyrinogen oxidase
MKPVLVVGAGLSGLAAAWALTEAGVRVRIVDAASRAGGLIGTTHTAEGLVEHAANAFVWTPVTARWFEQLGLAAVFPRQASRRRFIFARGRPRRWPLTVGETVIASARLGAAAVRRRLGPEPGESVAAFADRVGGTAVTRQLLGPALQGIYGAPPQDLCATTVFGARRRGRRTLAAPAQGMGAFIDALCRALDDRGVPIELATPVERLDPAQPTILCTNVAAAAGLVQPYAPRLARAMGSTAMNGLVTATAFFAPHADDLDGFGVLFPRTGDVRALGVLFNTSIFEGRGALRSETWIYPDRLAEDDDDRMQARIAADRRRLTGRPSVPLAVSITRRGAALPVYGPSIRTIGDRLDELPPWLRLSGNYLGQIGVSHLLERAEGLAADAARRWA